MPSSNNNPSAARPLAIATTIVGCVIIIVASILTLSDSKPNLMKNLLHNNSNNNVRVPNQRGNDKSSSSSRQLSLIDPKTVELRPQQQQSSSSPITTATQLVEKEMPFECIKCNTDSIPAPRDESICQEEWFYPDQAGDYCSLCEYGSIEPISVSRESVARKLVSGFGQIHIMGSSSMRHIYLNLVGAFRGNHDYTNSTIIEHYFHTNSNYAFNGTNDMLFVGQSKGQISLPNTSHAIDFIWNPMLLGLNENKFRNQLQMQQHFTHQKVMLVMGNHFWNSLFHDHIHMLVNTY